MILYLDARTTIKDLIIDYIEVELANGETTSLNWDESEIGRTGNGFSARTKECVLEKSMPMADWSSCRI